MDPGESPAIQFHFQVNETNLEGQIYLQMYTIYKVFRDLSIKSTEGDN